MFNRLIHFFSNNRIFPEAQNGVRTGKRIETAIHSFTERIQVALGNETYEWNILYLTKGYDVLNHKILLEKQYSCGIRGSMNSWFQSCLAK